MGVPSSIRPLSSAPGPAEPADPDLDSGWDDEPVSLAATTSIPPATEAIDSDWLSDDAAPAPAAPIAAGPAPSGAPKAEAKSQPTVVGTSAPATPVSVSVSPPAAPSSVTPADLASKDAPSAALASPSAPRSTTPAPPRASRAPERLSTRPSGDSGTRPAVKSTPVRAKLLTDGHPPEAIPAQAKLPADLGPQDASAPAPRATTLSVVAEQRELLPPLTLRPPSEIALAASEAQGTPAIAPPPAFTSSAQPLDVVALSRPPISEQTTASEGAAETFRPSEVDRPRSLPPKRSPARWLQAAAIVSLLAVGGAAWLKLRPQPQAQREARPTAVAARAPVPAQAAPPAVVEAPPAPAPEPKPAAEPEASTATPPAPSADLASAFAAALSGPSSPNAIAVTVRVTPAGSIIFDHGKRLGTDVVQVNVEPGGKKNLVALLDGYLPRRFTVDSTLNSVSIALRPQGLPTPSEPATYGTPSNASPPSPAAPAAQQAPAAAAPRAVSTPPKQVPPKQVAPAKGPAKKEAFDPSRDVGAL